MVSHVVPADVVQMHNVWVLQSACYSQFALEELDIVDLGALNSLESIDFPRASVLHPRNGAKRPSAQNFGEDVHILHFSRKSRDRAAGSKTVVRVYRRLEPLQTWSLGAKGSAALECQAWILGSLGSLRLCILLPSCFAVFSGRLTAGAQQGGRSVLCHGHLASSCSLHCGWGHGFEWRHHRLWRRSASAVAAVLASVAVVVGVIGGVSLPATC
mmetsp:Transcript_24868/g.54066  ORF Transcript_24868/g.54066 Transcript_24868/m.54066 type:complete len:214 (+) Transcript_24868:1527-2168(+)